MVANSSPASQEFGRLLHRFPVRCMPLSRQGQLRFHQAVGNARIISLPLCDDGPILVAAGTEVFLCRRQLELVFLPEVIFDEVFQGIKNARGKDMLAKIAPDNSLPGWPGVTSFFARHQ